MGNENALFDNTKVAAYHLWELQKDTNTVDLWYCAEDIALYFDKSNILTLGDVAGILRLGPYDHVYIYFVRNIAYRIHVYTKSNDSVKNWISAEKLINNRQWVEAQLAMANTMRNCQQVPSVISEWVKNYYKNL